MIKHDECDEWHYFNSQVSLIGNHYIFY